MIVPVVLPEIVQKYVTEQKFLFPKLRVVQKEKSELMKAIAWFFKKTRISPRFMEDYVTTIGNTIYLSEGNMHPDKPLILLETITHECIHVRDYNTYGILFSLTYMSPQVLALLSLLAFGAFWKLTMLWWLLSLLMLLPIPSPRTFWEVRAFRTSILFMRKVYNYNSEGMGLVRNWILGMLTTKYYYFAWPFRKNLDKVLTSETFMTQKEYVAIEDFLKREKVIT